ncbi:uncharacterized protein LOC108676585 [Hyalella azteca]|uniref:Uncharacterized protein LOC108676585 n=1 Tax=Hyalella azteca TaxID=294128 RepID=A0A8B7P2C1_HYAAZ|nr:uncharacterized protein LOC108676585 [Hyalella azteca]
MELYVRLHLVLGTIASIFLRSTEVTASLEDIALNSAEDLKMNMGDGPQWLKVLVDSSASLKSPAKSRQKRFFFPLELPPGLFFEVKWFIQVPVDTFTRFGLDLQFALLLDHQYPREFIHRNKGIPFREIVPSIYRPLLKRPNLIDTGFGKEDAEKRQDHILHRKKRATKGERHAIYRVLEKYIDGASLPARACLLRTICEVAETPLQDDLLGKLVTAILK